MKKVVIQQVVNKKRLLTLVLLLTIITSVMPIQAHAVTYSDMIGTWEMQNFVIYGVTFAADKLGADVTFVIHSDGTGFLLISEGEIYTSGRYELYGGKIKSNYYDDSAYLDCIGNRIPLKMDNKGRILVYLDTDGTTVELRMRKTYNKKAPYTMQKYVGTWYVKEATAVSTNKKVPKSAERIVMTIYDDGYAILNKDGQLGPVYLKVSGSRIYSYGVNGLKHTFSIGSDGTLTLTTDVDSVQVKLCFQDSKPVNE